MRADTQCRWIAAHRYVLCWKYHWLFYGISSYHWAQTRTFDRSFAASSVLWRFSTIFFSEMLMLSKKTKRTKKKENRKYSAMSTKLFGFQISRGNRALQSCRQPKIFEAWAFPPFCLFPLEFSPFMLFFCRSCYKTEGFLPVVVKFGDSISLQCNATKHRCKHLLLAIEHAFRTSHLTPRQM